jgi:ATP-dependent DNA helicase UvrD/PcrA
VFEPDEEHAELLGGLTEQQRSAVLHTDGPLLILAGAGSGKTRTVTRRIARMVADGISPDAILAITFTNKAASEMRERVEVLLEDPGERLLIREGEKRPQVTVSTFHAFAVKLLRRYADRVGFSRRFAILDPGDQLGLVREASVAARVDPKRFKPADLMHGIGRAKERLDDALVNKEAHTDLQRAVCAVLPVYRDLCQKRDAMDFDDLVGKAVQLLEESEDVSLAVQDLLRYVMIDEYQDTNHAQYRLARALTRVHGNLAVCGDPDQSIYGWRGADMANILRFEEDFPGTKLVLLEHNYRSTATILKASNHLIEHNGERKEKQLLATGAQGGDIEVVGCVDGEQEANYVARKAKQAIDEGYPAGEIAVVFRAKIHARAYEDALVQHEVPCALSGATSFFERAEIKDALAWIRLALNPRDDIACLRALRQFGRIGKRTIDKLHLAQRSEGWSLLEAAQRGEQVPGITEVTWRRLHVFAAKIASLAERGEQGVEALVTGAVQELDHHHEAEDVRAEIRRENLQKLQSAAISADRRAAQEGRVALAKRGREFLDRLALIDAQDRQNLDAKSEQLRAERVTLTTVHAAKGLEFGLVFCVGLEEGLFPHWRALAEGQVEEERRLAYVAFTRAKERLVLCYAAQRGGPNFGEASEKRRANMRRQPSRFLYELPGDLLYDPILREQMELPEREAVLTPEDIAQRKGGGAAPKTPRLAERGLKRRGKPALGKPTGGVAVPRWARGLTKKGR